VRRGALVGGLGLVALAILVAGVGMTGHMVAHMIAVAVAAPALALALSGGPLDPVRRWRALANPLGLSVVELAAVWLWHLPAVRHAAGHGMAMQLVELACFLLAGGLLWLAVLAAPAMAGVGALLLTSMHMTLLGALIGLAPRSLYPDMTHAAPFGLTPLQDQQLGGAAMLAIGGAAYLLGALAVLGGMLRQERTA
jgi:putative membrane protein